MPVRYSKQGLSLHGYRQAARRQFSLVCSGEVDVMYRGEEASALFVTWILASSTYSAHNILLSHYQTTATTVGY
jgi:hypothetical protein